MLDLKFKQYLTAESSKFEGWTTFVAIGCQSLILQRKIGTRTTNASPIPPSIPYNSFLFLCNTYTIYKMIKIYSLLTMYVSVQPKYRRFWEDLVYGRPLWVFCLKLKPTKIASDIFWPLAENPIKPSYILLSDSIAKTKVDLCEKILRVTNQIKIWIFWEGHKKVFKTIFHLFLTLST